MEISANTSWPLMLLIALTLGLRHGLDLDHLATIDAISRTVRRNRILSKLVGVLFSFGHGLVVIMISLVIGSGIVESHIPEWLEGFGIWVSIFFLVLFGALNLWNVLQKNSSNSMPVGIKSFLVKKMANKNFNPFVIMIVGVLFAFSFDTFSQIALFSISASLMAGWMFSGLLGILFMIGMMITDGLNGLFVAKIIQRADRASLILSRILGFAIAIFSLAIAIINVMKFF